MVSINWCCPTCRCSGTTSPLFRAISIRKLRKIAASAHLGKAQTCPKRRMSITDVNHFEPTAIPIAQATKQASEPRRRVWRYDDRERDYWGDRIKYARE